MFSPQAKGKERQWLRNQAYGDLDETKLIEGIVGERAIYKRRAEKEPEVRGGILYFYLQYKYLGPFR